MILKSAAAAVDLVVVVLAFLHCHQTQRQARRPLRLPEKKSPPIKDTTKRLQP